MTPTWQHGRRPGFQLRLRSRLGTPFNSVALLGGWPLRSSRGLWSPVDCGALDVKVGQKAVEPAGYTPGALAGEGEHSRHDGHPDEKRVAGDSHGKGEGERLDGGVC